MDKPNKILIILSSLLILLFFQGGAMALTLSSTAFTNGETIPSQYTCDGEDLSPPLRWKDAPTGTKSFVLIVDDPDAPAGTWDHWILYNIPATIAEISAAANPLPAGILVGSNSWGRKTYNGPCPPDKEHRYSFRLYALDTTLNLQEGAKKNVVEAAMKQHILASTELMGRYKIKRKSG